jgi:hypothetical protein
VTSSLTAATHTAADLRGWRVLSDHQSRRADRVMHAKVVEDCAASVLPQFPGIPPANSDRDQAKVGDGFLQPKLAPNATPTATTKITVKA